MDDADIAGERSEREMTLALRTMRSAMERAQAMDDGLICMICGEDIPKARRLALPRCCTCIGCQERIERGMGR